MATQQQTKTTRGGEYLIRQTPAEECFIPEEFSEETQMVAQTCRDFLQQHIFPNLDRIDSLEEGLMPDLLDKAGELGLLATSVPEEYEGFGMNFVASMKVAEEIGAGHSFAVALSAHTGIGTLPIMYYGSDEQKARYLPKLATGEYKASYCLTEPDSGSDANAAKSKAVLSEDGKTYHISGQKMWITNGGFADLFIVFAKIENDENLSAFIVERNFGGITMNEEEKKMGIKGSSTRQIFFDQTPVPAENLLSERGNGFKIALNILNIGRAKLAGAALGAARKTIERAASYAKERKQFGRSIASFGAIKQKLGEQAIRAYATEAALYRATQAIDESYHELVEGGMDAAKARLKSVEEYAIECALLKVQGSEMLDYVVDEGVQIYGGMGYSAEAPMERAYRDSRINRIFEGTNEINRMLAVDMVIKRAMKGQLDLFGPAKAVSKEIMSIPDMSEPEAGTFPVWHRVVENQKKALLMVAGAAVQNLQQKLEEEQEILLSIADMMMEIYACESTLLRTEKLAGIRGEKAIPNHIAAMQVYLFDATDRLNKAGKEAILSFAEGDERRMMLMGLKRFTKVDPLNTKDLRRQIADAALEKEGYIF